MAYNSSLGSDIVKRSKQIAESVVSKVPYARKAKISDFDIRDYTLDVDFDIPLGHTVIYDKPIITPYAGDGYGFICSQRENQSVITLPIDGDHSNSVIVGRVFEKGVDNPPPFNYGDVLLRHKLGHQWSFTYTQPIVGTLNLDVENIVDLEEIPLEAPEKYGKKQFKINSSSGEKIEEGRVVRVVLKFESKDFSKAFTNVYIEWEAKAEKKGDNLIITISDSNTIVGGPLKDSVGTSSDKNYDTYSASDFKAMLVSPPKGNASFSHYMGMGLFMDEYPSRIPIGNRTEDDETKDDGLFLVDRNTGNIKSWLWNSDSFLDDTLNEKGRLDNFPRGSINLLHYSKSGLTINEKVAKTYDLPLDPEGFEWQQSAIGVSLTLLRQRPSPYIIPGLNDPEMPLASFIMEDDCKNAEFNSLHIRLAQNNTGVQSITKEDIIYFDVQHYDTPYSKDSRLEHALPGTRPSRLQFYDLKRKPTEEENSGDEFKCINYIKSSEESQYEIEEGNKCKLNYKKVKVGNTYKYKILPKSERMTTYESGVEDSKTLKKKCPSWPGCVEGHYAHSEIDKPLEIRNTDIRINNLDLLIKPKANLELAHYTSSGLFLEEQLPYNENGDINYDDVSIFHAPKVTLRLREWDYVPLSDGTNVICYDSGKKNNAHEPKRYDLCKLEFETIYGKREQNFEEVGEKKLATYTDKHDTYKTASCIKLAQTIYGNKVLPEDEEIQLGNRLIFTDLLSGEDPEKTVAEGLWEESDSTKDASILGTDKDMRLILPKGKLELLHYTNSGLIIEEDKTALTADKHKPSMSLLFNHWMYAEGADGTKYRPMTPVLDSIDQVGTIKWAETADSVDPTASLVDFCIYHNTARDQHLTLETPTVWWDGVTEAGPGKTGAYIAIRESDNAKQKEPVVDITDSINSIKMDSKAGASKVEISNRTTQFTNQEAGVNKIILDAAAQLLTLMNGYEGGAKDGNNSIEMDKTNGMITIQDANGNNILIDSKNKKIVITDKDNKNTVTLDSKGILLDSNGTTITMKSGGDIEMAAGSSKIAVAKSGDIDIESATKINIKGTAGVIIEDPQVKITGGTLKVDGVAAPSGSGGFCALPACVFSGALHTGNMISGT